MNKGGKIMGRRKSWLLRKEKEEQKKEEQKQDNKQSHIVKVVPSNVRETVERRLAITNIKS